VSVSPGESGGLVVASEAPFVGRARERAVLSQALQEARGGKGSAWLVEGPAGMGKTRLVRWTQEAAEKEGFRTLWGYALKEVNTPFFPWQQVFRPLASPPGGRDATPTLPSPIPSLLVIEEERPRDLLEAVARLSHDHLCLILGRERPESLRARVPTLSKGARVLWISKGEGAERISPGDLDQLGDLLNSHFLAAPKSVVALTGLDYLVSQNSFSQVLRLVQFLRDAAEERGGHLLLALNPAAFEKREVTLLEGDGHVVREGPLVDPMSPSAPEPPASTMIRYIDTLEREAPRQPLLIVVDDLQWADPDSLRAFQFLARNIRAIPVALLGTLRTDETASAEEPREQSLSELLDATEREGTLRYLTLGGMAADEASELAHGLFGSTLALGAEDEALLELLRRSEGNPFFLKETLRQLAAEGCVRTEAGSLVLELDGGGSGTAGRSTVPASLRRLLGRRLEGLAVEEREVLGWAAVAGSEFELAPLERLLPLPPGAVPSVVAGLSRRERILIEQKGGRWSFSHPLLREVTLSNLTEGDRARRSKLLAEWWAEERPGEVETVARLFHAAMDPTGGVPWVRKALEGWFRARAPEVVERYHRWLQELLLAQGADADSRVREGLLLTGRLFEDTGVAREAIGILRSLQGLGQREELAREVDAHLAFALSSSAPAEAKLLLKQLERPETFADAPTPLLAVMGLAAARLARSEGRNVEEHEQTSRVLGLRGDVPSWVRVLATYYSGVALSCLGRMEEARKRAAEMGVMAGEAGRPYLLALAANLDLTLADQTGDVGARGRAVKRALTFWREVGNAPVVAAALANLGAFYVDQGDTSAARGAIAELRKHCDRFRIGASSFMVPELEGSTALRERRWDEAVRQLGIACDAMLRSGYVELLADKKLLLAEAFLGTREAGRARETVGPVAAEEANLEGALRPRLSMVVGWCEAVQGNSEAARASFDRASALASSLGHIFNRGLAASHLARWEEAFGDPDRSRAFHAEANAQFDASGVLPGGWAREWPPSFIAPKSSG
jgi:hypothetical protein